MDIEATVRAVADAQGRATAALLLQSSMAAMLLRKNIITDEECAEISGMAMIGLETIFQLPPLSDDMARAALAGWAASIVSHLNTH